MSISEKVREIMPEAIKQVSEGNMRFTVRQLFYKVRELYLKKYPNEPFFGDRAKRAEQGYDTFTQDFIPAYEKRYGKIEGMIREKRGNYCSRNEYGIRDFEVDDTLILDGFDKGVSDKILVVEKAGFYRMLIENRFPERFDINIICLQGYSTEAGRRILKSLEDSGFQILVLHDYDVNGVLIHETLTRPTKRREIFVNNVTDLGFNWEDVREFLNNGLTPEPVRLSKQDASKLDGMLHRSIITQEEYEFLKQYRVELNALTPKQFLEWLRNKFDKLGIWKVVPTEKQLKQVTISWIKYELKTDLKIKFKIQDLKNAIDDLELIIWRSIEKDDNKFDIKVNVDEFKELLKQNELNFWKSIAGLYARKIYATMKDELLEDTISKELKDELKQSIELLERVISEIKSILR